MASTDFLSAGRVVRALSPQSVSAGTALNTLSPPAIDTKGWRWAAIVVQLGTVAATANGTVTVESSATSGGTYAAISGASFTIEPGDDDKVLVGHIDLQQQARYLKIDGTSGTGGATLLSVQVTLYGCANTEQYIDRSVGGVDELAFTVLT